MQSSLLKHAGLLVAAVLLAAPAAAYDKDLANAYAEMFKPVSGAKCGKHLHLMKPEQYVMQVRQGKPITTVDIRTPGETQFFTANTPGHLTIPFNELFQPQNLARLPESGKIVLLCQSGVRATAAATALRSIGFENTYVIKGGYKALIGSSGPQEAYSPLGPETAAR